MYYNEHRSAAGAAISSKNKIQIYNTNTNLGCGWYDVFDGV